MPSKNSKESERNPLDDFRKEKITAKQLYIIYKAIAERPKSHVDLCHWEISQHFKYNFDIDSNGIIMACGILQGWGWIFRPRPSDADKPYRTGFLVWEGRPLGHWKWYLKKRGMKLKDVRKRLEKDFEKTFQFRKKKKSKRKKRDIS